MNAHPSAGRAAEAGEADDRLAELRGMGRGWRALRARLDTVATLTRIYRREL